LGGDRAARRGGPDAGNLDRARHLTSPGTDCCTSQRQRHLCVSRKGVHGAILCVGSQRLFWGRFAAPSHTSSRVRRWARPARRKTTMMQTHPSSLGLRAYHIVVQITRTPLFFLRC
ncbi:unnamed protein product, partial [Ectocarpus sp. 12 AP-2014]